MHVCHSLILGQFLCSCSCRECCIRADSALRLDYSILSTNCKRPLRGEEQPLQTPVCHSALFIFSFMLSFSLIKLHRTFLKQDTVVNSVSNNGKALFV